MSRLANQSRHGRSGLRQSRGPAGKTSGPSRCMCGVEMLELDPGVLGGEAPIDPGAQTVTGLLPGTHLRLERLPIRDAPAQALLAQNRQLDLRRIQPGAMLWGPVDLQLVRQALGFSGRKGLIER